MDYLFYFHKVLVRLFGTAYENSLWYVLTLFSAYFHKLSGIAYENI